MLLSAVTAQAQITIAGNVYGGGNAGDLGGKTEVLVYEGDIHEVYGGARQANVGGSTFVHIDGEHASTRNTRLKASYAQVLSDVDDPDVTIANLVTFNFGDRPAAALLLPQRPSLPRGLPVRLLCRVSRYAPFAV